MRSKDLFLRALINENKEHTLEDIKRILDIKNDKETFKILIDALTYEIELIDYNNYQFIKKNIEIISNYLMDLIKDEQKLDATHALYRLKGTINTVKHKRKTTRVSNKILQNYYNDLLGQLSNVYLFYDFKTQELEEDRKYLFLSTLIYQERNYSLLKYLFNRYPSLIKTNGPDGKTLLEEVLMKQLILIKEGKEEDLEEIEYYDNLLGLFLVNKMNSNFKKQTKQKIYNVIDYLTKDKKNKTINKRKIFFLKILQERLKNLCNFPLEDIKELNYKYGVNLDFDKYDIFINLPQRNLSKNFKHIYTIDFNNTQCKDDAFSIETLNNGNYLLNIYISNVGQFIQVGSNLDNEAFKRGKTIYLEENIHFPMLPLDLTNDICSLLVNQIKPVISCHVEIDQEGNVCDFQFFKEQIKVDFGLSYQEVDNLLQEGNKDLNLLKELSFLLKNKNVNREVYRDQENRSISYKNLEYNSPSHQIVSEYMILFNHLAAKYASDNQIPFLYRVHQPQEVGLNDILGLNEFLKDTKKGELERVRGLLNSSYSKAKYSIDNLGHYGLGYDSYSHSTAPLRRYADLVNQKIIEKFFLTKEINDQDIYFWEERLPQIALKQNNNEERIELYIEEYYRILNNQKIKSKR